MTIRQLSIFIENKGGTLIRFLDLISQANIQIIASTIADTKDYGIFLVLCTEPSRAYLILKEAGINFQLSDVFAITIDHEPGRAAQVVKAISDADISILYLYSFLWKDKGVLAFRANPAERAKEIIMLKKMDFLTEEDFR